MTRCLAISLLLLLVSLSSQAQFGNDWIQYDQQYVKFSVAADGLYRVPFSILSGKGLSVSGNEASLQLFHRGTEVPIHVGSDYIEFIGHKNDGASDTPLYEKPFYQPHTYYNLFSDTTAYFLTVGTGAGKRMIREETDPAGAVSASFVYEERLKVLKTSYAPGKDYGEVVKSTFDEGEGWMGQFISSAEPLRRDTIRHITHAYTGKKPQLEMMLTGRASMRHQAEIYVGASERLLATVSIDGYESVQFAYEIEWSDVSAQGELLVGVKVKPDNQPTAFVSVNFLKLKYSALPDVEGRAAFAVKVPASADPVLLSFGNAPAETRLFDVSEAENPREVATAGGAGEFVLRAQTQERRLLVASHVMVTEVKNVNLYPIIPAEYDYVIISHPLLRKAGGNYSDPVAAYSAYRATAEGGLYSPLVVNVGDLYDQFNFGEQSPLAIYRFMRYLSASHLPKYLFIIGKGLDPDYDYFRKPHLTTEYKSLVPSAGMPGSDMLFTAGLDGEEHVAAVPTGRITSMTPAEVAAYLDKVKEHEARPFNDLRRKHLLHLSGGIHPGEAQAFRAFLEEYAGIAEGEHLGAHVDAIAKESTDIKLINISREVNSGVALVTFFGHSSRVTLDFDVGFVSNPVMGYDNKGKYPVMLMNGCEAGAFFRYAKLFGEDWINARNKGAVGFIAHTSFGFVNDLRDYSRFFYQIGLANSYYITKGLGDVQKETARLYLDSSSLKPSDITQVQQMLLLGDPAVSIFGAQRPDYAVNDENISLASLNDFPVTAASDSFAIDFIVRNFGQAPARPLPVRVIRKAGTRQLTYDSIYAPILYGDTLRFIVRNNDHGMIGSNSFEVRVDPEQEFDELREDNNSAYIDVFLAEHATRNLYPRNFAIVHDSSVTLAVQHTDLQSGDRKFVIEVDTIATFDSPYKTIFTPTANVLARQYILLQDKDSLVYYWRTRLQDPAANESGDWSVSSFIHISGGDDGWAQAHFDQYLQNATEGLVKDAVAKRLGFLETVTGVSITTYGAATGQPVSAVSVLIDSTEYNLNTQGFGCRNHTLNLIAFDRRSTVPYTGVRFQWFNSGGRACGREPWVINSFHHYEMATGNNDDLIQYIDNIPPGDSVVLFTIGNAYYELWPEAARIKLGELGISLPEIQSLNPGEPFVAFGRKGASMGAVHLIRSAEQSDAGMAAEARTVTGRFSSGLMRSVLIGPAIEWKKLVFAVQEKSPSDLAVVDVFGVNGEGESVLLLDSVTAATSLASIDAAAYPFIRLAYRIEDDVTVTASQLRNWIVLYEPAPEGLLFYDGTPSPDVLNEGQTWTGRFGFVNVSDEVFDSPLGISYKTINRLSFSTQFHSDVIDVPAPGDTVLFEVVVDTRGKEGLNDLELTVNPRLQPEQTYDNNTLSLPGFVDVASESSRPVLDVTFDGRYILRDEHVSNSPGILVTLWDENPHLLKQDTSGVELFLSLPCEAAPCEFRRVNLSGPEVEWVPATDTSDFQIAFTPMLAAGRYELRVSAQDAGGNHSGAEPYEISFRVSDVEEIVFDDPYPNPAKAGVRFDFEVQGGDVPERMVIDLVSTKGEVFALASETSLHIGRNSFTYDLGSSGLPGGVYIYRMTMQINGVPVTRQGRIALIR